MRLIDADAIIEKKWQAESEACFYALEDVVSVTDIEEAPTIEVSEDCISREYVLDKLNEQYKVNRFEAHNDMANEGINQAESIVQDAPSVVPSRAEGEWELVSDNDGEYGICSLCGNDADFTHYGKAYHYCPNCGAKMKGADDVEDD